MFIPIKKRILPIFSISMLLILYSAIACADIEVEFRDGKITIQNPSTTEPVEITIPEPVANTTDIPSPAPVRVTINNDAEHVLERRSHQTFLLPPRGTALLTVPEREAVIWNGAKIKGNIVDLTPPTPPEGDGTDFFDANHDGEDALAQQQPKEQASPPPPPPPPVADLTPPSLLPPAPASLANPSTSGPNETAVDVAKLEQQEREAAARLEALRAKKAKLAEEEATRQRLEAQRRKEAEEAQARLEAQRQKEAAEAQARALADEQARLKAEQAAKEQRIAELRGQLAANEEAARAREAERAGLAEERRTRDETLKAAKRANEEAKKGCLTKYCGDMEVFRRQTEEFRQHEAEFRQREQEAVERLEGLFLDGHGTKITTEEERLRSIDGRLGEIARENEQTGQEQAALRERLAELMPPPPSQAPATVQALPLATPVVGEPPAASTPPPPPSSVSPMRSVNTVSPSPSASVGSLGTPARRSFFSRLFGSGSPSATATEPASSSPAPAPTPPVEEKKKEAKTPKRSESIFDPFDLSGAFHNSDDEDKDGGGSSLGAAAAASSLLGSGGQSLSKDPTG